MEQNMKFLPKLLRLSITAKTNYGTCVLPTAIYLRYGGGSSAAVLAEISARNEVEPFPIRE
jgi:hypothetical protein